MDPLSSDESLALHYIMEKPKDEEHVEFMAAPPLPVVAKLELDDLSGYIPFLQDVSEYRFCCFHRSINIIL